MDGSPSTRSSPAPVSSAPTQPTFKRAPYVALFPPSTPAGGAAAAVPNNPVPAPPLATRALLGPGGTSASGSALSLWSTSSLAARPVVSPGLLPITITTSSSSASPLQLLTSTRGTQAGGPASSSAPPPPPPPPVEPPPSQSVRPGSPKGSSGDEPGGAEGPDGDRDDGKRKRKRTSPEQLHLLETTFIAEQHPSLGMRNQLAAQLNMTPRSVQIWFQNRRAKARNQSQVAGTPTRLMGAGAAVAGGATGDAAHADAALLSSIFQLATAAASSGAAPQPVGTSSDAPLSTSPSSASSPSAPASAEAAVPSSLPAPTLNKADGAETATEAESNKRRKTGERVGSPPPPSTSPQALEEAPRESLKPEPSGVGSALLKAAVMGREEKVAKLLRNRQVTDRERGMALVGAASVGHVGVVERLLQQPGASPNAADEGGYSALHAAAKNGHQRIAELLIEAGADPIAAEELERETPLHVAALKCRQAVALLLLRRGAQPDARDRRGYSALHHAAVNGHLSLVRLLVDHRATIDLQCHRGRTPLHAAALHGFDSIAALLLQQGADPNSRDAAGATALHYAVRDGHIGVAARLLAAGCTLNAATGEGLTALHVSALREDDGAVGLLLEHADDDVVEGRDVDGRTPLHHACMTGSLAVARRLLAAGADPEAKDGGGDKPVQLAARAGHIAVVKALLHSSARASSSVHDSAPDAVATAAPAATTEATIVTLSSRIESEGELKETKLDEDGSRDLGGEDVDDNDDDKDEEEGDEEENEGDEDEDEEGEREEEMVIDEEGDEQELPEAEEEENEMA